MSRQVVPLFVQVTHGAWENRYHQLPPTTPAVSSKAEGHDGDNLTVPLELVTVPALGAEWDRKEMKQMTKSGRREIKSDERRAKWRAWNRGEIGLCGTKWFTRKFLVWFMFAWCAVLVTISLLPVCRWFGAHESAASPSYLPSPSLAYQQSRSTALLH